MAVSPRFLGPDGQYRTVYSYSTDIPLQFLSGRCDPDTADMQVAIRSEDFVSDADMVAFEGNTFIIPNPSAHPNGLALLPGANRIQVRSVLTNGDATAPAIVDITLSLERDVRSSVLPPTDVSVERMDRMVKISVRGLSDPTVTGYNFYGSSSPGGGLKGYKRINPAVVVTGEPDEATVPIGTMTADAVLALKPDGSPVADPTYFQVLGIETSRPSGNKLDANSVISVGNVIKTDFHQVITVPDTVSRIRTTMNVESVESLKVFSFIHDRRSTLTSTQNPAIPDSEFMVLDDSDPIYYVVTAIYYINGKEYESSYSPEVAASPLVVTPVIATLPTVSRQQIVQSTTSSIFRTHPEVDVKPGSVLRDTFIDPFSTEAERIRFIIGFIQSCQAFSTLLAIDDPGFTGSSLPVSQSPYKQAIKAAFFLQSDLDVQNVIDNAFDRLASSRGIQRRPGSRSRGEVTVYVTQRPTTSIFIPIGTQMTGGGVTVRTTSAGQITSTGAGSSYNPSTGRWSCNVFVQADQPGAAGNLAPGQIRSIRGGASGLQVINESSLYGGRNTESNRELAARCDRALASVDSGTLNGIYQRAVDVAGVQEVAVIYGGHELMMRDIDNTGRHTGGKVDVWLRGNSTATMTDNFAFSFEIVQDGQFEPVGPLSDLRFRVINPDVTSDNPIIEMIENSAWGIVFKDQDTGKVFNLTGVVIERPDTIVLSSVYNTPLGINITDRFIGTYRFRTSNKHKFIRQPADSILSLVGRVTGTIQSGNYHLFPGSPPLEKGRSQEAGSYLQVTSEAPVPSSIPQSTPYPDGEVHTFLDRKEYLNNLGVNPITIRVWDTTRTIEYYGPYHPSGAKDFSIISEVGETPTALYLTAGSRIEVGMTVLVDYQYDENFTVTYTVNSMIGNVQNAIEPYRHITMDLLAKDAIATGVDLSATIVMVQGQVQSNVDSNVRTALSRFFGSLGLGQSVRQSDIIDVIEGVEGVSYVVVPLTQMSKSDGSIVVREEVVTEEAGTDYFWVSAWSTSSVDVFLLTNPLESGTLDGGGKINDPRGVSIVTFDSNMVSSTLDLTLHDAPPNVNGIPIREKPNCAYIIGNSGLWIPGFSDDATLATDYPFATAEERDIRRIEVTADRILVALPKGSKPSDGQYLVSYVVYGDGGVKNLEPSPVEYLQLGNLNFVYDEDLKAKRK